MGKERLSLAVPKCQPKKKVTVHGPSVPFYVIARPACGPPTADGNLNRYILDCFVVKLLAMIPRRQLVRCERLQKKAANYKNHSMCVCF